MLATAFVIIAVTWVSEATTDGMYHSVLDFSMKNIDGKVVPLKEYTGKVIMIVNVASKCGHTPQYKGLETLYKTYGSRGFVILGFPANNFGGQEPGTNEEIKNFCTTNYNVTFPMFSKISVKGEDKNPLYTFLTQKDTDPMCSGEIKWNFTKFLIDRKGNIINRFEPKTEPEDAVVINAIKEALAD